MGIILIWALIGLISFILICKISEADVKLTDLLIGCVGGVMTFVVLIIAYCYYNKVFGKDIVLFSFKKKEEDKNNDDKKQLLKD